MFFLITRKTIFILPFFFFREKCGELTIAQLVSDAYRYGIPQVKCIDDPA